MTDERLTLFASVAFKDEETAKKFLAMTPSEVVSTLKADGIDFSETEVVEIGEKLKAQAEAMKKTELDETALDDVSGGKGEFWAGVALGLCIGCGFLGGW